MGTQSESKKKSHNSIKWKVLRATIIPILLLLAIVILVSYYSIKRVLIEEVKGELKEQVEIMDTAYEQRFPGDYKMDVTSDSSYQLSKGDSDITEENQTLDELKKTYGNDFTIFCIDYSVLTTLRSDDGNRIIMGEVSSRVKKDVIEDGKAQFYSNVKVEDEDYLAYFEPITWEDGTVFGMYGVYESATELNRDIWEALAPMIAVYLVMTAVIGAFLIWYTQKLVRRIMVIDDFMKSVSNGDLHSDIPERYIRGDDEITDLARSGKKMQAALRKLVEYDELTRLYNRRYADTHLSLLQIKQRDQGITYSVAIGDIDFFKKVNDTYGHDAGDLVLKKVSQILRNHMQGKGFVARWGGEEFLFAFVNRDLEEARKILEETLDEIRNTDIDTGNERICVTMSYGVTFAKEEPLEDLLRRADENLYAAKEGGRNRIIAK